MIQWLKGKKNAVVADMGCGEARLARSVPNKVFSFDLVSNASSKNGKRKIEVIACDISNVPLPDASVDIVIFCLSLMGTNIVDFIKEAHRILKPGGLVKIAEVRSRFHTTDTKPSKGNKTSEQDDTKGINDFVDVICDVGFDLNEAGCDIESNKMFFFLECVKSATSNSGTEGGKPAHSLPTTAHGSDKQFSAKPCMYKRR